MAILRSGKVRGALAIIGGALAFAILVGGCADLLTAVGLKSPPPESVPDDSVPDWALMPALEPLGAARAGGPVDIFPNLGGDGGIKAAADTNLQQHTFCEEGYDADVVLDPAGKWLAFSSTRHSRHSHLYLQRVDGVSVVQLTEGEADDIHPAFSPDGQRIAFASNRAGTWDLYITDIEGRNITQLTAGPSQDMHPSFSPDGSRLVYCSLGVQSNEWELWTINLSSQRERMLGQGMFPRWSPKDDAIVFQRARQRGERRYSVWTMELRDTDPGRATEVAASSVAAVVTPAWSPDGKRIVFATIVDSSQSGRKFGQRDLWLANADGSARQRLTDGGSNLTPFWGVDNRAYFVSDRGGSENVWSIRVGPAKMMTADGAKTPQREKSADVRE